MLSHVVARGHVIVFLKDGGEGCRVGESAGVHHLGDVHPLGGEQLGSLLQADVADKVVRRLTGELLHLTVEVDTADASFLGNHVDAEVGVAQILVDAVHDAVEELLIGRLEADLVDLLFQFVVALIF